MISIANDLGLPLLPDSIQGDLRDYLRRISVIMQEQNKKILDSITHGIVTQHISRPLDLSGSADTVAIFHAQYDGIIKRATVIYSEATSSDTGVIVKLGKESDDDYFFTFTSEVSKSQWDEKDVTLLQTDVQAGDALIFASAGNKTGTGEVVCAIELEYHVR